MVSKKSQTLKDIQEYLRGEKDKIKTEQWLIKAEQHIKELEKADAEQEILTQKEKIKKLTAEIEELKRNPHIALNASEKKVEEALHKVTMTPDYQAGIFLKIMEGLKAWNQGGNDEQKKAVLKYWDEIEKAEEFLKWKQDKIKKAYLKHQKPEN